MTDLDVIRWTVLVYLTWKGCGIGWKLAPRAWAWFVGTLYHQPAPFKW